MNNNPLKLLLYILTIITISVITTFAWFGGGYNAYFSASVVKYYFDSESGDGKSASNAFIITKPIHLYNLSYLQNKGYFSDDTYYFQLGKQVNGSGSYYFYQNIADDETSSTNLSSTVLDMSNLQQGYEFEPIGYVASLTNTTSSYYPFTGQFKGNNLVISNLTVHASSSDITYAGFFGVIKDGAVIKDFDLQNEVITSQGGTNASTLVGGLVIGYMDSSTDSAITLESIGCSDCEFTGSKELSSSYTFIGSGSTAALAYLDGFYSGGSGDTGDTGYIDLDAFTSGGVINTTISKDTPGYEYFGIFSYTGKTAGDGIYAYNHFSSQYPQYQPFFESSRIYIGGTNVNTDGSLNTYISIGSSDGTTIPTFYNVSDIATMSSSDQYYSYFGNMKKADGTRKTSFTNVVIFGGSSSVLNFTTSVDGAQVDIVLGNLTAPGSDYAALQMWVNKTSGSGFSELTINLNPVKVGGVSRGYIIFFRLTLGTAGTYAITSRGDRWGCIAYCQVVGVEGGQGGSGGIGSPIDFVDLETSGTNTIVNSTDYNYSEVGYTIGAPYSSTTYRIVFVRRDTESGGTTTIMVTVYSTPSSSYVTLIENSTAGNSTITNSSP